MCMETEVIHATHKVNEPLSGKVDLTPEPAVVITALLDSPLNNFGTTG